MPQNEYYSYVLRLHRAQRLGRPAWRAELQDVHIGEQRSFTLEGLLAFLCAQYDQGDAGSSDLRLEGEHEDENIRSQARSEAECRSLSGR